MLGSGEYRWWFGQDDLQPSGIQTSAEWSEHPFDALEGGEGLTLHRRNQIGEIDHRYAAAMLTVFACRQALEVIHLWEAPAIVREYLQTADDLLRGSASAAVEVAFGLALKEAQDVAAAAKAAEAARPRLGLFAMPGQRAAARAATEECTRAYLASRRRVAAVHAVAAARFATLRGTPGGALEAADAVARAAQVIGAVEGVVTDRYGAPRLVAEDASGAAGWLAAMGNARATFAAMVDVLFGTDDLAEGDPAVTDR